MPIPNTIGAEWARFSELLLTRQSLTDLELKRFKYVFYAGVMTMMVANKQMGQDDVSEDQACACLSALDQELDTFFKQAMQVH